MLLLYFDFSDVNYNLTQMFIFLLIKIYQLKLYLWVQDLFGGNGLLAPVSVKAG